MILSINLYYWSIKIIDKLIDIINKFHYRFDRIGAIALIYSDFLVSDNRILWIPADTSILAQSTRKSPQIPHDIIFE